MTLKEWFAESEQNKQAIYCARNGRDYCYKNGQRLSKFAQNLRIEQVVDLDVGGYGAWLYQGVVEMKYNGKKVNFSESAMEQVKLVIKHFPYIEARVENNDVVDDNDREIFIRYCDMIESCLEHLKSEVINND